MYKCHIALDLAAMYIHTLCVYHDVACTYRIGGSLVGEELGKFGESFINVNF